MNEQYAAAFNQWMDDYTKDPEGYQATEAAALAHLREQLDGKEPTYGQAAANILTRYLAAA